VGEWRAVTSSTLSELSPTRLTGRNADRFGGLEVDTVKKREVTDGNLLARIADNDEDALGDLFRRYSRVAYRVGQRILRDVAEADDFVQDLFLYIWRKCGLYDASKGSASSWIIQTIYFQALQRRMQLAARSLRLTSINDHAEPVALATTSSSEYEQSLEGVVGRARLREIVECLTQDQRDTLRLHFCDGYTLSEIARKRGQSLGNVRHHFYRGLEKLRSSVFRDDLKGRISSSK